MSFLKKFIKNLSNNNNNDINSDKLDNDKDITDCEAKRKFERKLVLSQSDPEPVIDLSNCRLDSIGVNVLSTIRIYNKTQCRFDHNLLTTFGCESMQSLNAINSLHLSYNRIHTIGQYIANITHLKELYLSHNQLSALPSSLSQLTELKILSVRDNKLTTFPDVITDCVSLSCIDLGDNRLTELPLTLVKLKLLKALQLDGNPILVPSREVCDKGIESIMSELGKLYNDSHEYSDNITNDYNNKNNMQTGVRHETKPQSNYFEDTNDVNDANQIYQNYQNQKDQKKRERIEWERSFQSNQFTSNVSNEFQKKKQILSQIWKEQRVMSANISNIQLRKAKDKETLLNNIVDLEKHSKQLIENLNQWENKQKQQLEMLEENENTNLEMMLRYDYKVNLKRTAIINSMQEMLRLESVKFELNDELKGFNQLEMRTKINQKEQLQREAFEVLQRTRDYRNQLITNQILLVENELTNLTQAEMQKKDDRLDCIMNDIRAQRAKLALLLSKLLADKKQRELQLKEHLTKMERRRHQVEDENFWLVQYQYLLEQQPIETQMRQFGIDEKVAKVLLAVSEENERVVNYLSLFTQINFERLNSMADKDLLRLGIEDYELCKLIRDKIDEHCSGSASASLPDITPSAPAQAVLQSPQSQEPSTSSTIIYEANESFCDIKLWCQTECVICFDQSCNVIFLPCGHVCTCTTCCALITSCPLCRVTIDTLQSLAN